MGIEIKQYDGEWQVLISKEIWKCKDRKAAVELVDKLSDLKEKNTKK